MLRYVGEQMPYSTYRILLDHTGRLGRALKRLEGKRPKNEVTELLKEQTVWFPFYVFDATKALRRGDRSNFQSLLEEMRKALFAACATREGAQVYGTKRGLRYLRSKEREIVLESYSGRDMATVRNLARVYLGCMTDLSSRYDIKKNVSNLNGALSNLL
jgi:hypothetical protein